MTTETTTTSTPDAGSANSDGFTPAEQAFFSSRGEQTEGLTLDDASDATQQPQGGQEPSPGALGAPDPSLAPDGLSDDDIDAMGGEDVQVGTDGKPRNKNGQFVSHQAFHAVREKYKTTRDELSNVRMQQARTDERLNVLNQILMSGTQEVVEQPAAPVDPMEDPIGALNHAMAQIKRLEDQVKARETQTAERDTARQMQSIFMSDAAQYAQQNPDFKDAVNHLVAMRRRELEAVGVADVGQREQMIDTEVRELVGNALKNRVSPAQMMHKLALARGFVKAAPQPAPGAAPQQPGADPAARIAQIAQGQRIVGATLTNAGGTSAEGLTSASLADMNDEDFAATAAKLGKAKLRQLMGG